MNLSKQIRPISDADISDYVQLYKNSYGNCPVWKEGKKNINTGELYTFDTFRALQEEGKILDKNLYVDYYTDQQVQNMYDIFCQKNGSVNLGFYIDNLLVGAISGYNDTVVNLQKEKFLFSPSDYDLFLKKVPPTANYLAELFVSSQSQGKGLGQSLLKEYVDSMQKENISIITRTTQNKQNPKAMFEKFLFEKVYEYPSGDPWNRAIWLKNF